MKKSHILFGFLLVSILFFPKVINAESSESFTHCVEPINSQITDIELAISTTNPDVDKIDIYPNGTNIITFSNGTSTIRHPETEPSNTKVDLKASTTKIVLNKITKAFEPPTSSLDSYFHLINSGGEAAKKIKIFSGELFHDDKNTLSTAPPYLNKPYLTVNTPDCAYLKPLGSLAVKVFSDIALNQTATYTGKIFVFGENVNPLEIEVLLNVRHDPEELMIYTLVGTLSATLVGIWFAKNSAINGQRSKYGTRWQTIDHINKHIKSLNLKSGVVSEADWKTIMQTHRNNKIEIEEHLNKLTPPKAEIVTYYETEDHKPSKDKRECYVDPLIRIKNPKFTTDLFKKMWSTNITLGNFIFAIIAGATAIPLTLFGSTNNFIGDPVVDIFLAMGVGFVIYETKNIGDAIKKIFPKPPNTD